MMMNSCEPEVWRDAPGFEGFYIVSSFGRVASVEHKDRYGRTFGGKILKQCARGRYYSVHLSMFDKRSMQFVHRLVAKAFLDNPNNYTEVNHKDENPQNNTVENLEWCDHRYNINYGTRNKISGIKHSGELCCFHKLTWPQVIEIRGLAFNHISNKYAIELANKYGVSAQTIKNIVHNRVWKLVE